MKSFALDLISAVVISAVLITLALEYFDVLVP